jgi:hypothetical protein
MNFYRILCVLMASALMLGCGGGGANSSNSTNTQQKSSVASIIAVDRPGTIAAMMKERGEQDAAAPTLKIVSPAEGSTINSSTVKVKLALSGDLKGYKPGMNEQTHSGNHIHVILDNQPYEAYYNLDQEFELRNVADGVHTLRVFPSRPWHESYKNDGAFQMVKFTVKDGGGDGAKPATTGTGETMSNANTAKPTPEGKEMKDSTAGEVDPKKPLLTFSRPKGEYKGADANDIMLDFWLINAKLVGDGGEYRVRYTIGDGPARLAEKWEAIWLSRWPEGKHTIKLELVDKNDNPVENGGYNTTSREITVTKQITENKN